MRFRYVFFVICAILLPFILAMNSVVLVFTPAYLEYEYKTPDFPDDPYGFTLEERLEYGKASVEYIIDFQNKYPDEFLAGLQFPDGSPLYNERELSHMKDVKNVYQNARMVMAVGIVFIILTGWLVSKNPDSFPAFLRTLMTGSSLTILLILLVFIGIMTGFDAFFEGFHHLFFSGDSWLFYADDSLIRLFPEPLWVHGFTFAAILVGAFAILIFIIAFLAWRQSQPGKKKPSQR